MKTKKIFLLLVTLLCGSMTATLPAQTTFLPKQAKIKTIEYKTTDYIAIGYVYKKQFVEEQDVTFLSKLTQDTIISGNYYTNGGIAYLEGTWKRDTENGTTRATGVFKLSNSDGGGLTSKPKEGKPLMILVDDIEYYQGFRNEHPAVLEKQRNGDYSLKVDYVGRHETNDLKRLELIVSKNLIKEYGFFAINDFVDHATSNITQEYNNGNIFIGAIENKEKSDNGLIYFIRKEGKWIYATGDKDEEELIKLPDENYKYKVKYSDRKKEGNFKEMEITIDQSFIEEYGFWAIGDYIYHTTDVKYTFKNDDVFIGKVKNTKDTINNSVNSQLTEGELRYATGEVFKGDLSGEWFCGIPITGKMKFINGNIENGNWLKKYNLTQKEQDKVASENSPTKKQAIAYSIQQEKQYNNALKRAESALNNADYQTAKDWYLEALDINPSKSAFINSQIEKLEKPIKEQALHNTFIRKYGEYWGDLVYKKKFTIGMTKAMVKEFAKENYYKKSISTSFGAQIETWEFNIESANAALGILGGGLLGSIAYLGAASIQAECPTLIFKNGKLTDIYR